MAGGRAASSYNVRPQARRGGDGKPIYVYICLYMYIFMYLCMYVSRVNPHRCSTCGRRGAVIHDNRYTYTYIYTCIYTYTGTCAMRRLAGAPRPPTTLGQRLGAVRNIDVYTYTYIYVYICKHKYILVHALRAGETIREYI